MPAAAILQLILAVLSQIPNLAEEGVTAFNAFHNAHGDVAKTQAAVNGVTQLAQAAGTAAQAIEGVNGPTVTPPGG